MWKWKKRKKKQKYMQPSVGSFDSCNLVIFILNKIACFVKNVVKTIRRNNSIRVIWVSVRIDIEEI